VVVVVVVVVELLIVVCCQRTLLHLDLNRSLRTVLLLSYHWYSSSPSWRKRWVVFTKESLIYFRNSKDKVPRDSISYSTPNDITIECTVDVYAVNTTPVQRRTARASV
jgi:hypothetical protein